MKNSNVIKSIYNVEIESRVIENGSDVLSVILPGIGYTLDRPLLDYSKKLCIEMGYDVLPIEYGFQVARAHFDRERFDSIIDESMQLLKMAQLYQYKKVIFIGKSIGTVVQRILQKQLSHEGVELQFINIYLTPVDKTAELGICRNSLVFTGTSDPLISRESVCTIKDIDNINFIEIEGADHSLNIKNDIVRSAEILLEVIKCEKQYLISNV
ncbi:alpha/beta family hydrolase [uncultured Clostridium sp.]|uniref:alpha/beta family hydrolase n=1 Tax=uncultured Clostridium sp. TaxID=59620 RepID=UPI0025EC6F84|nr:alpha/beta family hydrolase [uncultured Clostridium sp.]